MHSWINRLLLVLLTLAFMTPIGRPSVAYGFSPEQENRYLEGKDLLRAAQFTEASKVFLELLEQCRLNNEDRWQLLVALAVTYDKSDQWVAALEYYEAFLRALTPMLTETDQKWRGRYELAVQTRHDIQARLSGKLGRITLDSEPKGAEVWINGERAGVTGNATTPFVAYLPPGEHTISLVLSSPRGVARAEKGFEVALGKPTSWMASLRSEDQPKEEDFQSFIPPESPTLVRPHQTLGWTLTGAGALAAGTGLFMTARGLNTIEDMESLSLLGTGNPETSASRWKNHEDDLQLQQTTSWALYGAGAALVGAGIYFLFAEENLSGDSVDSGLSWQGTGASLTF